MSAPFKRADDPLDCDVVVVGLGPVGALITNLLAHEGLRVVALDREPDVMQTPRGVGIDGEMMRAMQTIGLAEKLEPRLKVFRGAQYLDANGEVVATRPPAQLQGEQGWPDRYNVHQPEFEEVLREHMRTDHLVRELVRHEVTEIVDHGEHVQVSATDLSSGETRSVRARYAIGADGGRSIARRAIGATYEDYGLNQPWIVADFVVTEDATVPEINTHYADPVSPAIYIHVVRDIRRFEFRAKPDEDLDTAVDPDKIWTRVARWLTPETAELVRAVVYTHRSLVVNNWRSGRILLAGDAAHQTPPFLGQGLCTGVRDAVSLVWRLRDVLLRDAPDTLLDSYGAERAAHAKHFITTATELGSQLSRPTKSAIDALNARIGREGRGNSPRLGDGLHDKENGGGVRSPQPRLDDGTLLDDLVDYEFAVLATRDALPDLDTAGIGRAVSVAASGPAADWLRERGLVCAIIRPDRYLFGLYETADKARDGLALLRTMLAAPVTV